MSAIITPGLRSVSLDAKICRPPAKQNPTICAYCRSFLERPLAPRCTYASPPEHDLIVLGPQDCRFCPILLDERAHFWHLTSNPSHLKSKYISKTSTPTVPIDQTLHARRRVALKLKIWGGSLMRPTKSIMRF
jgi:hypothetical protein